MAVLFKQQLDGVTYEVRSAGRSRRLYTNGAFHTQFNPGHLFTSGVWDLLSLPSLCMSPPPRRILVLGVAGGTVIHQLCEMHDIDKIVGVELDPVHLQLAREYFSLDYPALHLVRSDAKKWLVSCNETFDYIVDDIFVHSQGDPERPYAADKQWLRSLAQHLAPKGTLVQNHIDNRNSKHALNHFGPGSVLEFSTDKYENKVLAWFRTGTGKALKQNLRSELKQWPRAVTQRLRHQCRTISE